MSPEDDNNPQEDSGIDPVDFIQEAEEAIRPLALQKLAASGQSEVEASGFEGRRFTIARAEDGRAIVISSHDPDLTTWRSISLPVDPEDQDLEPFIVHIAIEGHHGENLTHADPENYAYLVGMLGWDIGL